MKATRLIAITLGIILLASAPAVIEAYTPSRNLELWSTGADVQALQQFLNAQKDLIAQTGPGSPGNEAFVFGLRTYQALIEFQQAHGLPATGFFGPLTRQLATSLPPFGTQFAASSSPMPATGSGTGKSGSTSTSTNILLTVASTTASAASTSASIVVAASSTAPSFGAFATSSTGTYVPFATPLPGYAPNQIIFIGGVAPAAAPAPAPAPYVAKAVHFDGATWLQQEMNFPNSSTGTFSVWFANPGALAPDFYTNYGGDGSHNPNFTNGQSFAGLASDSGGTSPYFPSIGFEVEDNSTVEYPAWQSTAAVSNSGWHHLFVSWNLDFPSGQKIINILVDGVPQTAPFDGTDGVPTKAQWSNIGSPDGYAPSFILIPDSTASGDSAGPVDLADFQLWAGTYIDPSQIGKFISGGKPIDPAVASSAFGTQTILLSGDASTFVHNQGTSGIFTLTGTLTDATSSPSN